MCLKSRNFSATGAALPSSEDVRTSQPGIGTLQPTLTEGALVALSPMGLVPLAHNDVADF